MKTAHLQRLETGDNGTFGSLSLDGLIFVTGELPDMDNAPGESCVPAGKYPCKWQHSPKFRRNVYHLQDVLGRSVIEIHSGNWCGNRANGLRSDVDGCILLGGRRGVVDGQPGVVESRDAVAEFEAYLAGEDFEIEIVNAYQPEGL